MISAPYILNRTKNLRDSLDSVQEVCQDIVCVLDTRSEEYNQVKKICQDYTSKIYDYDWASDSFADARNFAISKCEGDWWLTIDGDERLVSFEYPSYENDYYQAIIINRVGGEKKKHGSIRLCKNGHGIKYSRARHECVADTVLDKKQGFMNLEIRHIGYEDINIKAKIMQLIEKHFEQLKTEPDNFALKYHIAKSYWGLEDWVNCKDWAFLAILTPVNPETKAQLAIMIYLAYRHLGKEPMGLMWLEYSLQRLKEQRMGNYLFYDWYLRQGDKLNQIKHLKELKKTFITGSRFPNDIEIIKEDVDRKLKEIQNGI